MPLKKLSDCGHVCLAVLGGIVLTLIIIASSVTWWYLHWDDCVWGGDASYSLNLHLGICTDGMSDCTDWKDVGVEDNGDSDDYIAAYGICVTAIAITFIFLISTCIGFIPAVKESAAASYLRFLLIGLMVLVIVFLISAMATTTNTWYTDSKNYGLDLACPESSSNLSVGWISALIAIFLGFATVIVAAFPCCHCIDRSGESQSDRFVPAGSQSDVT